MMPCRVAHCAVVRDDCCASSVQMLPAHCAVVRDDCCASSVQMLPKPLKLLTPWN
jgi:hypothetical protein